MFNKNDPLISAVQEVMKRNHAEREAAKVVNEKFGVYDRKALPHERQGEWDAAFKSVLNESDDMGPVKKKDNESVEYEHKISGKRSKFTKHPGDNWKVVKEELKGNQHRIDVASADGKKKPDGKLTKHDFEHLRSMKEEEQLDEKKMSDAQMKKREEIVNSMKKGISGFKKRYGKKAKDVMYATATKQAMKEDNEGFNNRHGLSENASAEKQAVAVLNEQENPIIAQRKKYAAKRKQAAADKKTTERIKAREPREPTSFERFQAREKQSPTKVIGGSPSVPGVGLMQNVARLGAQAGPRIFNYLRNRVSAGQTQPQPNLAAGAARRTNQSVPQVTSTPGSATGRFSASGPFGSIRDASKVTRRGGDARAAAGKDTRGAPSGTMMARLRQQSQQVQQGRAGGSTVAATQAASRTRLAQQTQQGRVGTNTTGATQAAARTSLAQRIKGMRAGGATAGARRVPQTAFANEVPGISTAPNAAQADSGPEKIKTSTQTTTTQPDYDKMSFGQAFKAARQQAGGAGGKFKYKGKEYQTNIKGTGIAKKPQEKYQPASKLKDVTPAPTTKTSTSVVGGQGIAAVPGGTSSAAAKPVPSAAKERANFAGPPSGTSSLTRRVGPDGQGGIKVGQDKPMGMSFRPQTTVDAAKKPAASVTPQMSQSVGSLQQKASMAGKERGLAPDFAKRELTRRQNIQTVKGA